MLRRILAITARDFKSSAREFVLLYIIVAPIILATGLTVFIPSVESASVQFAVDHTVGEDMIAHLEKFGQVEKFGNQSALRARLSDIDEVIGVVQESGKYRILLYGDERRGAGDMISKIVRAYIFGWPSEPPVSFLSLGETRSPVALVGAVSLVLTSLTLGGGIIGLNIIEEKESGTIRTIISTPASRSEFVAGKTLTGALTAFLQIFGVLIIIGFTDINIAQTMIFTAVNILLLTLFGFLIGVFSSNQVIGIANMKFILLPVSVSVIGALMLPKAWQFILYWSPFYWSYLGYSAIIQGNATWYQLGVFSAVILIIFAVVLIGSRKRIVRGLS